MRIAASILAFCILGILIALRTDTSSLAVRAALAGVAFAIAAIAVMHMRARRHEGPPRETGTR